MGGKNSSDQSSTGTNVGSNTSLGGSFNGSYGTTQGGSLGTSNSTSGSQNSSFNNSSGGSQGSSQSTGSSQSAGSSVSSGNSQNQSTSTQDVWGAQQGALENVYGQAQDQYGQAIGQINALQPQVQGQMSDALNGATNANNNQMGGGFAGALQGQVGPNSYTDAMKGQIAQDSQQLMQQSLGGLDARAAAAGMSGSSGYRDQVGNTMDDINQNAMNQMTQVGYQAHDRGIQNQLALSQQMDQNQQSGVGNLQNIQQGAMNQFNPAMQGLNAAAQLGGIIGGPTVLGSSQSTGNSMNNSMSNNSASSNNNSSSNNSSFNQATGGSQGSSNSVSNSTNSSFNNGMNVGMGVTSNVGYGDQYGVNNSSGTSSGWNVSMPQSPTAAAAVPAVVGSDIRLKTDIKHVDQVDGVNLYEWNWREDAPVTWDMHYGVIAQEVANTHPEAVSTGDHGYLMVDYNKLGRAGQIALARAEV